MCHSTLCLTHALTDMTCLNETVSAVLGMPSRVSPDRSLLGLISEAISCLCVNAGEKGISHHLLPACYSQSYLDEDIMVWMGEVVWLSSLVPPSPAIEVNIS